jgi:hypothetical protein
VLKFLLAVETPRRQQTEAENVGPHNNLLSKKLDTLDGVPALILM